jgi:hypothetical protein
MFFQINTIPRNRLERNHNCLEVACTLQVAEGARRLNRGDGYDRARFRRSGAKMLCDFPAVSEAGSSVFPCRGRCANQFRSKATVASLRPCARARREVGGQSDPISDPVQTARAEVWKGVRSSARTRPVHCCCKSGTSRSSVRSQNQELADSKEAIKVFRISSSAFNRANFIWVLRGVSGLESMLITLVRSPGA